MNQDMFTTHLTFFDDDVDFNFGEEDSTSIEGSVPPSITKTETKLHTSKDNLTPIKVKRKCGRPRNPIPRHKRVSHINAEHRRRGKIQNCFRTLKNMVPKHGEVTSGRDSKSDILFKAIDYSKKVLAECEEQKVLIESLQQEIQQLNLETQQYQDYLPHTNIFDTSLYTLDDRLEEYIQYRTRDNWKFWIVSFENYYLLYSFFIRPVFESFKQTVISATFDTFNYSILDWATNGILCSLRDGMSSVLRQISTDTSIMTDPNYVPHEALVQTGNMYEQNYNDINPTITPDPELGLLQMCYTSL
ncbi:hypothetical protein LOTGIDRAFT_161770 [Lottia gigantea]|uniref:BHLH domain-containing protein n=1 Tax=Lottia gigantea TaxID=225164 RepID=V4BVY0_LOTGI|nr:hypothetical protein LOTGIDRAFT_161770 [Lottia gigantea]ESO93219.1 hypothetical protein LOTGIDRAFT_161770 [Lottia gigantea]